MKVGITYDLRDEYLAQGYTAEETAEFDSLETVHALSEVLTSLGCQVELIGNIHNLIHALNHSKRWDLVFNIAEGLHGLSREAQIPAVLDAFLIPYTFADVATLATALNKSLAKRLVAAHGIATPDFQVISCLQDLQYFNLPFPVFVKPLAEGTSKGISANSHITEHLELEKHCATLLQRYKQPVLIEKFLSGREFTVAVIGNDSEAKAYGVMEIIFHEAAEKYAYSFINKEFYEGKVSYQIASDAEARQAASLAVDVYRALSCRDAARIDIRSDEYGVPHFLEVNPIVGLNPIKSDLIILMKFAGYSYHECISKIFFSACNRIGLQLPKCA